MGSIVYTLKCQFAWYEVKVSIFCACFRRFRQHFLATASLLGVWNPSGSITTINQNALLWHGEENVQVFVLTFLLALLVFLEHHA